MWGRRLFYVFLTRKRTLLLPMTSGTSSAPLVPSVHTSSSRVLLLPVPVASRRRQLGFRRRPFRLHLEDGQGWEEPWPVSTRLSTKAGRIREVHPGIRRRGGA